MITKIHIKNFKSIYDLELKTARINLFIGENGSGKSNLLEALVFASASDSNKLDNEFLVSRGLRVSEPHLMRSAFDEKLANENIIIDVDFKFPAEINSTEYENITRQYELMNENNTFSEWVDISEETHKKITKKIDDALAEGILISIKKITERLENTPKPLINKENSSSVNKTDKAEQIINLFNELNSVKTHTQLENFLIYSPENTALRVFAKEGQIQPLGINGEGLLKLLKVINHYEDKSYINTIIKSLQLFNWFEAINIPDDLSFDKDNIRITDKFLYQEIDQRSANEGFLFILFYITLIVAKETPKIFAIDNIDASLNPKLCTQLMIILTDLAQKYDKQIFLTTHNPAILDGIDLGDEQQKLYVVSRNKSGHTRVKEKTLKDKPKSSDDEPLKLSEAFLRGYLGGLPKGF